MLVIPPEYQRANVVAFDPGSDTTGVAVVTINPSTAEIISATAWTLRTAKIKAFGGFSPYFHTERECKLGNLFIEVQSIMEVSRPWAVGCEAPFFNRLMPSAYGSLTEVVTIIQSACMGFNPYTRFELLSPQSVKKSVGVAGKKGKDVMRDAVLADTPMSSKLLVDINTLDEHAIDALAVARCMINFRLFN